MSEQANSITSMTLLGRLRDSPTDQSAWAEFVERYGPRIAGWCRQWGLQAADAQDVSQSVLLAMSRQMSRFEHRRQGGFRGWLKTIAHRAWCDLLEQRSRAGGGTADSAIRLLLESVPARESFLDRLEELGRAEVLEMAMTAVRQRVQPQTWEAFRLTSLDGLSGAEAAERLGMKAGTVFVAGCRVEKMLREEICRLEGHGPENSPVEKEAL